MALKGLVRFFTVALIVSSVYQLSFTGAEPPSRSAVRYESYAGSGTGRIDSFHE